MEILSLLNCVPCVLKTCPAFFVLTCQRALYAYVLTQRALRAYVLTCQRALCAHVPTCLGCLRALRAYVLTYQRSLRDYLLTCQRASFDATIFTFAAIFAEVVHTVGKV